MPKFGGPGKKKKRCIERACKQHASAVLSHTSNTVTSVQSQSQSESVKLNVDTLHRYTTEEIIKVHIVGYRCA